jgi:hypothetical protein
MKTLFLLLLLSLSSLSAFADILPIEMPCNGKMCQGQTYVRVRNFGVMVKFEKCTWGYEESTCQNIGREEGYAVRQLQKRKHVEAWQAAGAATVDVVIIAGMAIVGGKVAIAVSGLGAPVAAGIGGLIEGILLFFPTLGVATMGAAVGAVVGTSAMYFRPINASAQYKDVKAVNNAVILDREVRVNNIDAFILDLENVLAKIN